MRALLMEEADKLLARLLLQEELLQFTTFTNDVACDVGMRLIDTARREGKSVTVDVSRNGQQLFHYAMPGTSADNDAWIQRKIRVVNRFGHSSFYMGRKYATQNTSIQESALLDPTKYAPHGGAFPAIVKDVGPVGVITVSGLPQAEDHDLVTRVIAEYLGVTLPS
jgi:uncharacterized protein (UPF0303 family)